MDSSRVARAEADPDVKKSEVEELALDFVKQHLMNESQKSYDELSPKHPLRKMVTRTVLALAELESASSELNKDKK